MFDAQWSLLVSCGLDSDLIAAMAKIQSSIGVVKLCRRFERRAHHAATTSELFRLRNDHRRSIRLAQKGDLPVSMKLSDAGLAISIDIRCVYIRYLIYEG